MHSVGMMRWKELTELEEWMKDREEKKQKQKKAIIPRFAIVRSIGLPV